MASIPSTNGAAVAPILPPRPKPGFITSHGVGRVCADPGCRTTLSRYNKSDVCYPHANKFEARRRGGNS